MKRFKIVISTLTLLLISISVLSSCKSHSHTTLQQDVKPEETQILKEQSEEVQVIAEQGEESQILTEQNEEDTDKNMVGVFLLLYDQQKGEEKRDVSNLIAMGLKMTAHFYEDGRGYIIPGTGIEEFTWGNGIMIKGSRKMTYTFEGDLLLVEDVEDGYRYWYKRTDQELDEYPVISPEDLP